MERNEKREDINEFCRKSRTEGLTEEKKKQNSLIKKEIRRLALEKRNAMSGEERRIASLCMTERLLGHQWFYRAKKILLFASFGSEIDTAELTDEALRMGKEVFLPCVEKDGMQFYRIFSRSRLKKGYHGILEPDKTTEVYGGGNAEGDKEKDCVLVPEDAPDTLMIMPGVAFDPYRNRLGYGKGFYDRYLTEKPWLMERSIAVGFRCQMVEKIPCEEFDRKPCQVLVF